MLGVLAGRLPDGENQAGLRPFGQGASSGDTASAARGRVLYEKNCLACHGPSGRGDGTAGRDLNPEPSDLSQPEVIDKTDAELFRKITRGRRPMPSFNKLPADDRWQIVRYVRAITHGHDGGHGR